MYYAILFFVTATSLWISPQLGDGIRVPKEIMCVIGFLSLWAMSRQARPFRNFWIKAFLLWGFALTSFLVKNINCFYELFYVTSGAIAISALATTSTLIPTFHIKGIQFQQISFEEQVKGISKFICWVCALMSTYLFIQALAWDSIHTVVSFEFA
ncbi:unnamed protein product, partial [marine sediment metagenome]